MQLSTEMHFRVAGIKRNLMAAYGLMADEVMGLSPKQRPTTNPLHQQALTAVLSDCCSPLKGTCGLGWTHRKFIQGCQREFSWQIIHWNEAKARAVLSKSPSKMNNWKPDIHRPFKLYLFLIWVLFCSASYDQSLLISISWAQHSLEAMTTGIGSEEECIADICTNWGQSEATL